MFKKISILLLIGLCLFTLPVHAAEDIPQPYFADQEFQSFIDDAVTRYNEGNTGAIYEVYTYIISGACSQEQVQKVLEMGYFTDHIDDFKQSGFLNEDYILPDTVIPITVAPLNNSSPEENESVLTAEDPAITYIHDLDEITSLKAQQVMVDLMNDNVLGNAYVTCSVSVESKLIDTQMIEISAFTGESLTVLFMDGDHAAYTWKLGGNVYTKQGQADLAVSYDKHTLDYDLGITLPKGATLYLYTGEPEGTTINLKNSDGSIAYALDVDDSGFISIPHIIKDGHFNISKEYVSTGKTSDNDTTEGIKKPFSQITGVSNVIILSIILLLTLVGVGAITYTIISAKRI